MPYKFDSISNPIPYSMPSDIQSYPIFHSQSSTLLTPSIPSIHILSKSNESTSPNSAILHTTYPKHTRPNENATNEMQKNPNTCAQMKMPQRNAEKPQTQEL